MFWDSDVPVAAFMMCGVSEGVPGDGPEVRLTSRCLSSPSSSLDSSGSSKASARVESTCRPRFGDDAREWKEGGGELGAARKDRGSIGDTESSSSWALTYDEGHVNRKPRMISKQQERTLS